MLERHIKWNKTRRFGFELEFDGTLNQERLADIINRANIENETAYAASYRHNSAEERWCCKTDSSCGYEIASRVMSGHKDLKKAGLVIDALRNNRAAYNTHCGHHIHVEICDFNEEQKQILTCWWIKVEQFILNAYPAHRRNNIYCTPLNRSVQVEPNIEYPPREIYSRVSGQRGALNMRTNNPTVEFRFGDMSLNSEEIKNRIRFLVWLTEICKNLPAPPNLNWFSPKQTMRLLGLWTDDSDTIKKTFSPAITSMKKWILKRFKEHAPTDIYRRDHEFVDSMLAEIDRQEESETLNIEIPEIPRILVASEKESTW